MRTAEFDYDLPAELIAQRPAAHRSASRLLVVHRRTGELEHRATFEDLLVYLRPGDLLVLNDSRVIQARLRGRKVNGSASVEMLLVREVRPNRWWTMLRPGKRIRAGTRIALDGTAAGAGVFEATVVNKSDDGQYQLDFDCAGNILDLLPRIGEVPLPPYIERTADSDDQERYQTVFAQAPGSVAAPTAGLHFTHEFLNRIKATGVEIATITLHVGPGTFAPVKTEHVHEHGMHEEHFVISPETAQRIEEVQRAQGRIVAVGTTTVRVLESVAAQHGGRIVAGEGSTRIYIYPPYPFRIVDALLTNFHLPRSSLLMLVSAFASPGRADGRELVLRAYGEAVRARYRFFSYGDAMFLL